MKPHVLKGSKQEIAEGLARISGEVREAIVFVEEPVPAAPEARTPEAQGAWRDLAINVVLLMPTAVLLTQGFPCTCRMRGAVVGHVGPSGKLAEPIETLLQRGGRMKHAEVLTGDRRGALDDVLEASGAADDEFP